MGLEVIISLMKCYTLDFPIVDLSTSSYGTRVSFSNTGVKTNPRNEMGKFGIRTHSRLTKLFHQTIKIANTNSKKIFYINKKSSVKWLQSVTGKKKITNSSTDEKIVKTINKYLKTTPKQIRKTTITERSLSKINLVKGLLWQKFFNFSKESWFRFKARFFLFKPSEITLKRSSQLAAIAEFFRTKKTTPAYQELLDKKTSQPKKFSEIPITSKDTYIKPHINSETNGLALYKGSIIPNGSKNDTSTGTTGDPTQWYRGPKEQKCVEKLSSYAAKAILGNKPYYFINGFALGQWASGLTAFSTTRYDPNATISNPGMDVRKIFEAIKQATKMMPKDYPIVVAGYPPHLREVVDLAISEGFDLSQYNITGVVGGEGISEGSRELIVTQKDGTGSITRNGFSRCFSTYGASDLDINIGYESEFEVELRKICHERKDLALELFDDNGDIPMIFHYDPLNYHIESTEERQLIFTCVRDDRISPRIRYNLGDVGKIMSASDLIATLKKHQITLKETPRTELPFVFVWGRKDSMISYRGANLSPENLGEAIRRASLNEAIIHYGFFQHEVNGQTLTELLIEKKPNIELDANLAQILIVQLKEINPDFRKQYEECREDTLKPKLRIFEPGESPMSLQRNRYPHAKKKYIFIQKEGDEFTPNHNLGGLVQEQNSSS
jgi:phenylacetate-coenzyme A ligase PaaK-like adenylate-forming protein